jgi:hypothetical protein
MRGTHMPSSAFALNIENRTKNIRRRRFIMGEDKCELEEEIENYGNERMSG